MYAVSHVFTFVLRNRSQVGTLAPHIISRAFLNATRDGMILSEVIPAILVRDQVLIRRFQDQAPEVNYSLFKQAGVTGWPAIEVVTLMTALFGDDIPGELITQLQGLLAPGSFNAVAFGRALARHLSKRGVEWHEEWVRFGVVKKRMPN